MDRRAFLAGGSLSAMSYSLTGCLGNKQTTRSQSPDLVNPKDLPQTIGDITLFDAVSGIPVSGVGLVVGLQGTGGGTPPGEARKQFEEYVMRRIPAENRPTTKAMLDSPNNALVYISGVVPVGSRRNDRIDLALTLPENSRVKSLRGGYLVHSELSHYESKEAVRGFIKNQMGIEPGEGPNALLKGNIAVYAEGPLHAPMTSSEDLAARKKKGKKVVEIKESDENENTDDDILFFRKSFVWQGGRCRYDRPYYLLTNEDNHRAAMTKLISDRINQMVFGAGSGGLAPLAEAKNNVLITLMIPDQYRLNTPHFLRVVRAIPLQRVADQDSYRRKLRDMLQEPATALSAAIRLEALGKKSITILQEALDSPYPVVRFAAAESLAYLNHRSAIKVLGNLCEQHPVLQAFCLTGLASIESEIPAREEMDQLIQSNQPEIRYGVFRALHETDPNIPEIRGEKIMPRFRKDEDGKFIQDPYQHAFYLHINRSDKPGMVHFLSSHRAEIVLFGREPKLIPGAPLTIGEFTVTSNRKEDHCIIARSGSLGQQIKECSLDLASIIRVLGQLGATYAEVVHLIKQASELQSVNCTVVMDALPKAVPIPQLAEHCRKDPKLLQEMELLEAGSDYSESLPQLYDEGELLRTQNLAQK